MRQVVLLLSLILLFGLIFSPTCAGKLDDARKEVEKEKKSGDDESDDGDIPRIEEIVEFFRVAGLIVAGPIMLARNYLDEHPAWFTRYPYWEKFPGCMIPSLIRPEGGRARSFRLSLEHGWEVEQVRRATGRFLAEFAAGPGISLTWASMWEDLGGGETDHLSLIEPHLFFRYVQGARVQLRAGGGVLLLTDDEGTDTGWSFSNQADIFPGAGFVISPGFSLGSIGGATISHGFISLGFLVDRWEPFAGFDYRAIGSVAFNSFSTGLRLWF